MALIPAARPVIAAFSKTSSFVVRSRNYQLGITIVNFPTYNTPQVVAMVTTRRSSTRISAVAASDEKKTVPEKPKTNVKSQTQKAAGKTDAVKRAKKPTAASQKRKAVEADPEIEPESESEPEPRAEKTPKTPATKKAKKPATGKKEAPAKKSKDELKALRDASASVPDINPDAERRKPPETRYWLMKSEPEVRVEDGYEIKFSIDDLAAKKTPEGWEGIRNYAARNNLRDMRKGDQAFFYHSNCKEPGIVGIITIVKEHSPDWNACINDNPYYDDSAPHDGSKWSLVHVKIEHKFPRIVPLSLLKEVGFKGPLQNMQLLKLGRLSVNRVTKEEWDEVIRLAKELDKDNEWDKAVEEGKKCPNYSAA